MLSVHDFDTREDLEEEKLYTTCLKGSREEIRNYCQSGDIASQYLKDGMNPLHVVVTAGRKDVEPILDMMLQSGFDVNAQTRSGEDTVLHLIVENMTVKEAFPLVLKILEYSPDLTIRNRKLRTAYDIAVARDEFELAEVLDGRMSANQAREFYIKRIGALYGAKLIEAVLNSNENEIREYLHLGADPDFVNEHKNGAIHYAITHCRLSPQKSLGLLLEGGANVNLQDDEGDTALNLVIKMTKFRETGDMYKCAELLVNHGALSTLKDLDGFDALALSKKRNYADIVKLLTSRRQEHIREPSPSPEPPPIARPPDSFLMADEPEVEAAPESDQIEAEAPVPQPGPSRALSRTPSTGPTPVPVPAPPPPAPRPAPSLNDLPPLPPQFPVDEEDDYNHPPPMFGDDDQLTPQPIMADYLTPRDPEFNPFMERYDEADEDELLAHLSMATKEGTPQDVKIVLEELGPNPNVPDDDGLYPIHYACMREFENEEDRIEMIQILMSHNADINAKTVNSESTPMHIAATNNQDHVAKLLLDTHKCDYNAKNKLEQTPYDVAQEHDSPEVMEVIDAHRRAVRAKLKGAARASTCILL